MSTLLLLCIDVSTITSLFFFALDETSVQSLLKAKHELTTGRSLVSVNKCGIYPLFFLLFQRAPSSDLLEVLEKEELTLKNLSTVSFLPNPVIGSVILRTIYFPELCTY